jgi:hypothetical protein
MNMPILIMSAVARRLGATEEFIRVAVLIFLFIWPNPCCSHSIHNEAGGI